MAVDERIVQQLVEQSPFARYETVDVEFAVADVDTPVLHELTGVSPDDIRWTPLSVEGKAYVYRGLGTQNEWTGTTIWLRASDVCRARLLLIVEHP